MRIVLSTTDEALAFLAAPRAEDDESEVEFAGELAELQVDISGARYEATVPTELARGLWEFQEALYKAAAFALYGTDDIRKLTYTQRADLELVFAVGPGSTAMVASLKDFLGKLGEGFTNMDSRHKAVVLVAIALLLTTGLAASNALEADAAVKKEEIKAQTQVQLEAEKTRQFEILAQAAARNPTVAAFDKAAADGTKAIVKGAPDATQVRVGQLRLHRGDIEEMNQRATRERPTAQVVQRRLKVAAIISRDSATTRFLFSDANNAEFPVVVSHEDISADDLERLWAAARNRRDVTVEVNLTLHRGVVRSGQILSVPPSTEDGRQPDEQQARR